MHSLFLAALAIRYTYAQIGLSAQLFQINEGFGVNNAKLAWDITGLDVGTSQSVQRATSGGPFVTIATVTGNTYDDYNLRISQAYSYRITSSSGMTDSVSVTPFAAPSDYSTYDNTVPSSLAIKSQIQLDGVYYQYNYVSGSDESWYIQQQTSSDGYDFSGDVSVLNSSVVCAPINTTCHLERTTFLQHPITNDVVMWAHLENTANYDLAQVACAYGLPGADLTFCGTYRPLGHDSRDLTFWADDSQGDNTGYLISATDTNTNINIYQLTSNWTSIASLANTVLVKQYREAPAMIKQNEEYYLFTSRAAGWYPSAPSVIWTSDITGNWSASEIPGDAATYATQSGSVVQIGDSYAMLPDRWSANWSPAAPPNRELCLPISFPQGEAGYARYHFYRTVQYAGQGASIAGDQAFFGVQSGNILSRSQPLTATPSGGSNLALANDGVENNSTGYFTPAGVPFNLTVDLGTTYEITQVDLATKMVQGSETYYQYTVVGSVDGTTFEQIYSQENNTDVGFSPSYVNGRYRYVGVSVTHIINTHNGHEADWAAGVRELTVYGSALESSSRQNWVAN